MDSRVSVFVRQRRINNLEQWTIYAILTEAFFLALSPTIAAAAVMIGVITWFLRAQIDSKYKMRSLPFDVPVAIFLLIGALSVFLSSARSFELIYNYCTLVGIYALTYLIVGQTIRKPEQIKQIAQALGASAILVVLCGFFQFIFGIDAADVKWTDPEAFPELKKRIFSTLENPNVLAGYLDVCICLALGILAKIERRSHKLILIGAIILLVACLTMTYSRGAFLTLAIVFAIYGLLQDWRILILFAAVTGIIFYSDSSFMNRILSTFAISDTSESVRVGLWVSTSAMISDHPFTGIGWGAYQYVYPQYNYYIADPNVTIYHAHNIYLNFAAETGIVGALAFFWYFFGTMFMSLALGANERFVKIREFIEDFADKKRAEFLSASSFAKDLAEMRNTIRTLLTDFSNNVLDLFGKKKTPLKLKKLRRNHREVIHNEEMNFSEHTRRKFANTDKNLEEENSFAEKNPVDDDDEEFFDEESAKPTKKSSNKSKKTLDLEDMKFIEGFRFGIGLAFLSMALNGFTDDLLFNIPSSMLMWQLGALSASINLMNE